MQTMMTTLKRGRKVWSRVNMPESEFQDRIMKIRTQMKKKNIDILLVYGNGPDSYGDPCYISNFIVGMGDVITVVPREGKVALIFSGSDRGMQYEQEITWVSGPRTSWDISKECIKYLKENKLVPANLGFAGLKQLMSYQKMQNISEGCKGSKIIDADQIIKDLRIIKTAKEQDQIQRSGQVLKQVFNLLSSTAFKNLTEREIDAIMDREARLEGAEDFRMLIANPRETKWAFRPVEDQGLSSGDSVIVYAAVELERYWTESIRTFKVEPPHLVTADRPAFTNLYNKIVKGFQTGKTISQFYQETLAELQKSKVAYLPDLGLGQGIGISLNELPLLKESETGRIKEGMCVTLSLGLKDKAVGAIMIGNTICLGPSGPQIA